MRITTLLPPLLSAFLHTPPAQAKKHKTTTSTTSTPPHDPFSASAASLISTYFPSDVQSMLYAHYTAYAHTKGTPLAVIQSAFLAPTAPAWLDTVEAEFQHNIEALESAISVLRTAVSPFPGTGTGTSVSAFASVTATATATYSKGSPTGMTVSGSGTAVASVEITKTGDEASATRVGGDWTVSDGVLVPMLPAASSNWGSSAVVGATGVLLVAGFLGAAGAMLVV